MEGTYLTGNDQALREATLFYSASSCLVLTLSLATLYGTSAYLQAGRASNMAPMLAIFTAFELVKWYLNRLIYQELTSKDRSVLLQTWKHLNLIECIKTCLLLIPACALFYVLAVIFGAEIGSKYEETSMFSCLLTTLTVYPMCLHLGRSSLKDFINGQPPANKFHWILRNSFVFTLAGAWLGATVIPLDWNRPWQEWPISCSFGAIVGYTASHYYALIRGFIMKSHKTF